MEYIHIVDNNKTYLTKNIWFNRLPYLHPPHAMSGTLLTGNADVYNPQKVLKHHDFKILAPGEIPPSDANIAAFYNPNREIHLVQKPRFKPGPGQVLVHVKATGICG